MSTGSDPPFEQPPATVPQRSEEAMPPGGWYAPPPVPVIAPLAGWWQRVGAAAIDGLVLLVPVALLSVLLFFIFLGPLTFIGSNDTASFVAIFLATLLYVLVIFVVVLGTNVLYAGLTMRRPGVRNGQTLGKQALGIRVVRMSGDPQTFWSAALREVAIKTLLFGGVGGFLMGIPTLLDYLWPLWDDQRRALHDMLAGTRVVSA